MFGQTYSGSQLSLAKLQRRGPISNTEGSFLDMGAAYHPGVAATYNHKNHVMLLKRPPLPPWKVFVET